MSGMSIREAARQALRARLGVELKQEMEAKDAEISALKAADAEKEERLKKMEAFMAQMMAASEKTTKPDKHKGA